MNNPSVIIYFVITCILKYNDNDKYVVEVRLHYFVAKILPWKRVIISPKNVLRDMFYFHAYNYENKIAVSAFIIST